MDETDQKNNNAEALKNYLECAKDKGALVYLDGSIMRDAWSLDTLLEDNSYMMDIEGNEQGEIVRINFQHIRITD